MNINVQTLSSDRIQDTLYAFTRSQILFAAIDLDIFSHIAEGANTTDALIERLDLSERGLRILLDGLIGIGFLKKDRGSYQLPEDVRRFLVKENEEYIGGMVHHCKRLYENWEMLTDAVRSGQPVGGAQSLAQLETYFAELVKGLYVSNYPTAKKLATLLEVGSQEQALRILDVAGGSAVWSIAMLEKDPTASATVLDFPSVIHVAEEYVAHHNLEDRYDYWPGDLEEMTLPEAGFNIAILANICHTLGPVSTRNAFEKLYRTIQPGGKIVIVDFVPDNERSKPGWPLIFSVNMLVSTPEGDVFTSDQYEAWLKAAGFRTVTFHEVESEVIAVIGEK